MKRPIEGFQAISAVTDPLSQRRPGTAVAAAELVVTELEVTELVVTELVEVSKCRSVEVTGRRTSFETYNFTILLIN